MNENEIKICQNCGKKFCENDYSLDDIDNKDEIELYMSDYHHSSQTGSTLVAYTMLCTIFGVDVRNVDYSSGSKWRDKILKQAAYNASMHKNM